MTEKTTKRPDDATKTPGAGYQQQDDAGTGLRQDSTHPHPRTRPDNERDDSTRPRTAAGKGSRKA